MCGDPPCRPCVEQWCCQATQLIYGDGVTWTIRDRDYNSVCGRVFRFATALTLLTGRWTDRQDHHEPRAAAIRVFGDDAAVVRHDNLLDEGQAQTRSSGL